MAKPILMLVVEVVSSSTKSDDYSAKWSEYSVLNIPEYWIVESIDQVVIVSKLVNGRYQDAIFRDTERIISPTFPDLNLEVDQVLTAQ